MQLTEAIVTVHKVAILSLTKRTLVYVLKAANGAE